MGEPLPDLPCGGGRPGRAHAAHGSVLRNAIVAYLTEHGEGTIKGIAGDQLNEGSVSAALNRNKNLFEWTGRYAGYPVRIWRLRKG